MAILFKDRKYMQTSIEELFKFKLINKF